MNTTLHLPAIPRLSFAWLLALLQRGLRSTRPRADSADELDSLAELDARTLHDIAAPDRLLARALARQAQKRHHDELTLGIGVSSWRHW
jgi:hypothetical protein